MTQIHPIHYRIRIEPDLNLLRFKGLVEIKFEAQGDDPEIALDVLELDIERCRWSSGGGWLEMPFRFDPTKEKLLVSSPSPIMGTAVLQIEYTGTINNKMAGFYCSKTMIKGREKWIASTQFQEMDARRAFPCWDHPAQKAVFEIEMIVEPGLKTISNTPIKKEKKLGPHKKSVYFQPTPKMSTYLVFFAIGEFGFLEDRGKPQIRVAALPAMLENGKFGLDFGRKALNYSGHYFGIPYPLPKLDLIAITDFAFGAMENWGAITFRENLILHYPGVTSRAGEERICEVIAHEIAHQWFGNLVTPLDWKYLWLNESFATFFGYGIVDRFYPQWEVWDQFVHNNVHVAFDRDAFQQTTPIEMQGLEKITINLSTAPIIYSKGGSMLRMIAAYIGQEAFQAGVKKYLREHAYACAASRDLWDAFESVSSRPIRPIMQCWVEQPGFPLLTVTREADRLLIQQSRFTCLPLESEQNWLIPLTIQSIYQDGRTKENTVLLDKDLSIVDLEPDVRAYKLNSGQNGFFRVRYQDSENLAQLGVRIFQKDLPPLDRWGLENDFYALVKSGTAGFAQYLDFLNYYRTENAWLPLLSIADHILHAYLVMNAEQRSRIAGLAGPLFARALADIGYEPGPGETHGTSQMREQILWPAVLFGRREIVDFALTKFRELRQTGRVHEDLMKSVMQAGALYGDQETLAWFKQTLKTTPSEHMRGNICLALGCFKDQTLIGQARRLILEEVPKRNIHIPFAALAANPYALPDMWEWFLAHHAKLEEYHPLHYERILAGLIPYGGIGREQEVIDFFNEYSLKMKPMVDTIKLSLEHLAVHARMRAGAGG